MSGLNPTDYRARSLARSRQGTEPLDARQRLLALYGLGITGEAGEVADEIKKLLFHGKPLDVKILLAECGDVLWYIDRILLSIGYTIEEALLANDAKLADRYPGGWDAATKHYDHQDSRS